MNKYTVKILRDNSSVWIEWGHIEGYDSGEAANYVLDALNMNPREEAKTNLEVILE